MTGRPDRRTVHETEVLREVVEVKLLLGLLLFVLALPVLVAVAIARGPAALVLLLLLAFSAPILLVAGAILWHRGDQ